ncbi:sca1 complex scaffold protein scaa [Anaeramoeba ignava]|uniref:Sca1 complex scaffold protein scaa n=1 Tax=Anaeramoeba ignava TaxID=1746090 RepID=A0A9Q0LEI1_ANAIG|nr:sca1 complex scaffold protein scaa [Anaeramoeba ignava]
MKHKKSRLFDKLTLRKNQSPINSLNKVSEDQIICFTSDNKSYTSSQVPKIESKNFQLQNDKQKSAFIGFQGEIHDIFYRSLETIEEKEKEKEQNKKIEKDDFNFLKNLPKFPNPDNYVSYSQFEQEAFEWKRLIANQIDYIKLPHCLGRNYQRPRLHRENISKRGPSGEKSLSAETRRTSSGNPKSISRHSSSGFTKMEIVHSDSSDLSKVSDSEIIEKFVPAFYENSHLLIKPKDKWSNDLIPSRPQPQYFTSFEEYEFAYINWANYINKNLKQQPPHPNQFQFLYGLRTGKERKKQTQGWVKNFSKNSKTIKLERKIGYLNKHFSWASKINQFFQLHSIISGKDAIQNIKKQNNIPSNLEMELNLGIYDQKTEENIQTNEQNLEKEKEIEKEKEKEVEKEISSDSDDDSDFFYVVEFQVTKNSEQSKQEIEKERKEWEKKLIIQFFDKIAQLQDQNRNIYCNHAKQPIGIIKAKLIPSQDLKFGELSPNPDLNLNILDPGFSSLNNLSSFALRRKDLSQSVLQNSFSFLPNVDKKYQHFKIEDYDIPEPFDLKRLSTDKNYLTHLQEIINYIDNKSWLDTVDFHKNPSNFHEEILFKTERRKMEEIIKGKECLTTGDVRKILYQSTPLDFFAHLIDEQTTFNFEEQTFGSALLTAIKSENFHEILSLLNDSCSFLTQTKVARLVSEVLQTSFGRSLISRFVQNNDIINLYYIAYSMSLLTGKKYPIFPFSEEIKYVSQLIKEDEKENKIDLELELTLLTHYYLSVIQKRISTEENMFLYVTTSKEISQKLNHLEVLIESELKKSVSNVEKRLFSGIGSNSFSVSEYYSFILKKFLNHSTDSMIRILQSNDINILGNIRKLSKSKFSHVQLASKKFWETLVSDKKWQEFLVSRYSKEYFMLITDFKPDIITETKENKEIEEIGTQKSPLMNFLVYIFLKTIFGEIQNSKSPSYYLALLRGKLFFDLLVQIEDYVNKGHSFETLVFMSKIMKMMVKKFAVVDCIKTEIPRNVTDMNIINSFLVITYDHFEIILSIISKASKTLDPMKIHFISILRILMSYKNIFKYVDENNNFIVSIIKFIKEQTDFNLVSNLWWFLFELIHFHPNFLSKLIKNKIFKSILELISPANNPPVIIYGFDFLCLIFNSEMFIHDNEKRKRKLFYDSTQKKLSKLKEKDAKMVSDFLNEQSLFVSYHMIFKTHLDSFGRIFINIAKFYYCISTTPVCSKLFNSIVTRENYKAGLDLVSSLYEHKYKLKFNKKKGSYNF